MRQFPAFHFSQTKCFCGVTIPDIGMRDKRPHMISVLCTEQRRLDRIKRCKQVGTLLVLMRLA